jgi:hypothetical protein
MPGLTSDDHFLPQMPVYQTKVYIPLAAKDERLLPVVYSAEEMMAQVGCRCEVRKL